MGNHCTIAAEGSHCREAKVSQYKHRNASVLKIFHVFNFRRRREPTKFNAEIFPIYGNSSYNGGLGTRLST